jgi:hypothetical protein
MKSVHAFQMMMIKNTNTRMHMHKHTSKNNTSTPPALPLFCLEVPLVPALALILCSMPMAACGMKHSHQTRFVRLTITGKKPDHEEEDDPQELGHDHERGHAKQGGVRAHRLAAAKARQAARIIAVKSLHEPGYETHAASRWAAAKGMRLRTCNAEQST